jgi:protein tyrosine/serine phosphatase
MRLPLLAAILSVSHALRAEPALRIDERDALAELQGSTGPARFGVVREGLYRGGQPSARHLELLRALGVETVVDLRHGDAGVEGVAARRLGMRFVRFPFYGIFGADSAFLARIVDAVRRGGRVYVHCRVGRDRTSLVVALYRVLVEGWDPETAWRHEAVDYGYARGWWYGAIADSFFAAATALGGRR